MGNEPDNTVARKRARYSLLFPAFFVLILWLIYLVARIAGFDLSSWCLLPRRLSGLKGILLSPLVHANARHLFNNSVPLFFLMASTLYFYRDLGYRVILHIWLIEGAWVWVAARPACHIGASGLVYGLASFLFFSGLIRNHVPLVAISLLVAFLYGSMIWGIFPILEEISWESHMMGALAGLILAILYRHEGPQKPPPSWELEEEEEDDVEDENISIS